MFAFQSHAKHHDFSTKQQAMATQPANQANRTAKRTADKQAHKTTQKATDLYQQAKSKQKHQNALHKERYAGSFAKTATQSQHTEQQSDSDATACPWSYGCQRFFCNTATAFI